MQEQMNSLNSSGEFQDIESHYSRRLFHISSQLEMIQSSRALLSHEKRLPHDTRSQFGVQENVFGNQFSTFDSLKFSSKNFIWQRAKKSRSNTSPTPEKANTILAQWQCRLLRQDRWQYRWNYQRMSDSKDSKCRNYKSANSQFPHHSWCGNFDSKIKWLICSDFPSEAVLWIKEVEMVDSLDELKSSRAVSGKDFTNFEMLDAKIASALNKIIQNCQFKKEVSFEEQKAQKEDQFLWGRQIAFMIYDYFRVTGAHDTVLDYADLFSVTLRDDHIQEFDTIWDEVYYRCQKYHPMKSWQDCTNWGYASLINAKPYWTCTTMEIHQKISVLNYQKLKTMVNRSTDQKFR